MRADHGDARQIRPLIGDGAQNCAAGGAGCRLKALGGGAGIGEFARIDRPHMQEHRELAVLAVGAALRAVMRLGEAVDARLVRFHAGGEQPCLLGNERDLLHRAGGAFHLHGRGGVGHGLACDEDVTAGPDGAQGFLLQIRLLHQPVREAAQQIGMGAAALQIARPQPGVIGQQQADAPFIHAVQHQ